MSIAGVDLSVSPASDEATPTGLQTSLARSASVASPNILDQKKESAWAALVAKTLNDEKKKGMIQCVWYTSLGAFSSSHFFYLLMVPSSHQTHIVFIGYRPVIPY